MPFDLTEVKTSIHNMLEVRPLYGLVGSAQCLANAQALDALQELLAANIGFRLPIGLMVPLAQGEQAFAHVAQQRAGRAILTID